jgi:hypothetical protein
MISIRQHCALDVWRLYSATAIMLFCSLLSVLTYSWINVCVMSIYISAVKLSLLHFLCLFKDCIRCGLFLLLPSEFSSLPASRYQLLRCQISKESLAQDLHKPTTNKICSHNKCQLGFELDKRLESVKRFSAEVDKKKVPSPPFPLFVTTYSSRA